jgi:hypothetical protein
VQVALQDLAQAQSPCRVHALCVLAWPHACMVILHRACQAADVNGSSP